ncbi:hypothetical protein RFI_07599 [Reticulomyxa filosa]|uniref:Uncharacterized protein n=1 Tax=Reticulomyxa filosa TaxID=46433 RepID=X6NUB3_RETFI|nr:hypothetical protein RFI_07599 [Reticulomyxa filosa]|eukprot:ETO29518.1 hypothetical protein RFI_07599 [Reticulomyxa filosa]
MIDILADMTEHYPCRQGETLQLVVFELWEKSNPSELAAASFGYLVGSILHDYTFITNKKDKRSAGNLLTKTIGHLLQECGYDLWYWGFKLDYMAAEYENAKYNGKELSQGEFWDVLKHSLSHHTNDKKEVINCQGVPVKDVTKFIADGSALVQPLPQWLESLKSKDKTTD